MNTLMRSMNVDQRIEFFDKNVMENLKCMRFQIVSIRLLNFKNNLLNSKLINSNKSRNVIFKKRIK